MKLYELTWHAQGTKSANDWFEIHHDYKSAKEAYDALSPEMIAEIEQRPVTVSLKEFEPLARDGSVIEEHEDSEAFYEQWYSDSDRRLVASKHA